MRLVMTFVVRDEEELIAANLDFHRAMGVDLFLVTDHRSEDATPEILAEYAARGEAIVFREEGAAFEQHTWTTRMARLAATEHGADWVLNNDADEFWWPLLGTLEESLAAVPERYGQIQVPRTGFIVREGEGPFWQRMTIRPPRTVGLDGREIEPNTVHRGNPDVEVSRGNHWAVTPGMETAPPVPVIEVLEYPVRDYEQFQRKVEHQGTAYLSIPNRDPAVGRDHVALYELMQRGGLREHYDRLARGEDYVRDGLAAGELVEDRRIERFMSALAQGRVERPGRGPEVLAARRLAESGFAVGERLEESERALAEIRDDLTALRDRHDETFVSLELVRNSRLFRLSRAPRRAWYRARRVLSRS